MKAQLRVTAFHLVDNLSTGLYADPGHCLSELIRNSAVACMPNPDRWEPQRVRIEIRLEPNHPLSPDKKSPTLVVLDHGCGLTAAALDRYFNWLGTPVHELVRASNGNGASQKGIGRIAALALNIKCLIGDIMDRLKSGYSILTRTQPEGKVRFVTFIPKRVEDDQGIETECFIDPGSAEMGSLRNIKGSFTAVVIPTPVLTSVNQIYEAIKWRLPRERNKMYSITIGGREFQPPALEDKVTLTSDDGDQFRAYLGVGDVKSGGVWLCDSTTGLRVASCVCLDRKLPEPLWFPDLVGDIFAPNLLRYQTTDRATLARDFMRKGNKDWQALYMFLIRQVIGPAKQLIERDLITGDAAQTLDELVELFNQQFGPPEDLEFVPPPPPPPPAGGRSPRVPTDRPIGPTPVDKPQRPPRPRHVSIRIRNETYHLYRGQTLSPFEFAQVNMQNPRLIYVNVRGGYQALPHTKAARREHCLLQILYAVGQSKFPSDPYQAMRFTNEVRAEFLANK